MIILVGIDYICFLYENNNILTAADKKIKNINHTGVVFAVVLTVLTVVLIVGLGLIVVLTVLAVVLAVVLTIVLAVSLAVVSVDSCIGRWTLSCPPDMYPRKRYNWDNNINRVGDHVQVMCRSWRRLGSCGLCAGQVSSYRTLGSRGPYER